MHGHIANLTHFFTKALPHALVPLQQEVQTVVVITEGDRSINAYVLDISQGDTKLHPFILQNIQKKRQNGACR